MDIVEQYTQAWNSHDTALLLECFHEDGIYIDANLDDEIPASLFVLRAQELFDSFPDLQVSVEDRVSHEKALCALRWSLTGVLPDKVLRGVDMLSIRDHKLQSVQVYFDYQTGSAFAKVPSLHLSYRKPHASAKDLEKKKYRTSRLTDSEIESAKLKLEHLMSEKHLFLDQDLSLSSLAEHINLSTNHLSQIINSHYRRNFYDYINRHRIGFIIDQMKVNASSPRKGLALALDAGFRSSSTFYAAFKKETGYTPKEYREQFLK